MINLNGKVLLHLLNEDLLDERNIGDILSSILQTMQRKKDTIDESMKIFIHEFIVKFKDTEAMMSRSGFSLRDVNNNLDQLKTETSDLLITQVIPVKELCLVKKFNPSALVIEYINSIDKGVKCSLLNTWWYHYIDDKSFHVKYDDFLCFSSYKQLYSASCDHHSDRFGMQKYKTIVEDNKINDILSEIIGKKLYDLAMKGYRITEEHELYQFEVQAIIEMDNGKLVIRNPECFDTIKLCDFAYKYRLDLKESGVKTLNDSTYAYDVDVIQEWLRLQESHSEAYMNVLNSYVSYMDLGNMTITINYDYFDGFIIEVKDKVGIVIRDNKGSDRYNSFADAQTFLSHCMDNIDDEYFGTPEHLE